MTSNGSDPAPTKTRWVPSNDSTAGSPDELQNAIVLSFIMIHENNFAEFDGEKSVWFFLSVITALQANLQLVVCVPLEDGAEGALQDGEEDGVHRRGG